MKKTAVLLAGAFALAPMFAFADSRTLSEVTPAEQARMKQDAAAKKAAVAGMTPDERAAAKRASNVEHQKYQDSIIKLTQNPGDSRNMGINKSAAASKAGPMAPRGTINTPEAEKLLLQQKGQ
jgi:hypothetical protein